MLERENRELRERLEPRRRLAMVTKPALACRGLLDQLPHGVVVTDARGVITSCNGQAAWMLEREVDELRGATFEVLRDPLIRRGFTSALAGTGYRFEARYTRADGRTFDVEVELDPVRTDEGVLTGAVATLRDVSEHKAVEAELRLAKRRLEIVRDLGVLATSSLELDVVLLRILQGTLEASGATAGMIFLRDPGADKLRWGASLGLSDSFVAAYRQRLIALGEGLTGTIAATGESIYIPTDSSRDPRVARAVVQREELNSFIGVPVRAGDEIIGVMNVLTRPPAVLGQHEIEMIEAIGNHVGSAVRNAQIYAQLQAAKASVVAEQRLTGALIDALDDTFFVYDAETGRARRWNRVFRDVSGYSDQEIAALKAPDAYYDAAELAKIEVFERRHRQGRATSVELKLVTKRGERVPFEYTAATVEDEADGKTYLVAIGRDQRARKKIEEELLKVQKLESLGVLSGGIAHDFNNLLAVIVGALSFSKMRATDAEVQRALDDALAACMRSRGLTQQLLTFSREHAPHRALTDLAGLVRETCGFVMRGSNVACDQAFADELWPAEVDEGQIGQVLQNLLLNGAQAMPKGGRITVTAENVELDARSGIPVEDGRYVRLSVADHGVGIAPEHLGKIFDPYFTTKDTGTGLGLATSYSIVKNHGGHILVESELGRGTTFHVYLPASEGGSSSPRTDDHASDAPLNARVLVMDDDALVRRVLGAILQEMGCTVALACDGREALEAFRQARQVGEPFDVALLDLTVPGGMGAEETMARLRRIDPDVRAVVASGYANDPILSELQAHGFRAGVAKPFTADTLRAALRRALVG
ncbi:MAG: PAS domain S-box protein [Myxococcales bacterium]|nr:PAS domain S-box protein [Myxococcales bacterium]